MSMYKAYKNSSGGLPYDHPSRVAECEYRILGKYLFLKIKENGLCLVEVSPPPECKVGKILANNIHFDKLQITFSFPGSDIYYKLSPDDLHMAFAKYLEQLREKEEPKFEERRKYKIEYINGLGIKLLDEGE
jgi:hypothetical protein